MMGVNEIIDSLEAKLLNKKVKELNSGNDIFKYPFL